MEAVALELLVLSVIKVSADHPGVVRLSIVEENLPHVVPGRFDLNIESRASAYPAIPEKDIW